MNKFIKLLQSVDDLKVGRRVSLFAMVFLNIFIDIQTSKTLIQMDINEIMRILNWDLYNEE